MPGLHTERPFEEEVCEALAGRGWLYGPDASPPDDGYDRERALFPADAIRWVRDSNPDAWAALRKSHGAAAEGRVLDRLRKSLDAAGTLTVLREGIELVGLRGSLKMAQFKPASGLNPAIEQRYEQNRLRVVRQVRYSVKNGNSLDLVLFLNGIPVATAELKTENTQSIDDAVDQYKLDRNPRPKGGAPEPLLTFRTGPPVHFAVSGDRAKMTTKLAGPATRFLPFDRGDGGAAGNPLNPRGHRTAYLWEEVWERASWLEILGRYLVEEKDAKGAVKAVVFPRYHQLDATRRLRDAVLAEGPGRKYLIQHSAGSGKTKSIAWTAHFLADLHDAADRKVFDTVIVVSDRKVIDTQLQAQIEAFERNRGVVAVVTGKGGSKSGELADALGGGKKIVVCTIQTFPFALQKVRELAAAGGKTFAVLADEAHSSQSGEAAGKLKEMLSAAEWEKLKAEHADGEPLDTEEILAAQMAARADEAGITYVAFTATPKPKTLELFGRVPDPDAPAGPGNTPEPFHVYSMRQAIEEGFILDVLRNYTPYKLAFRLAHEGVEVGEAEVDKAAAKKGLMKWVRLHEHNVAQKVKLVVEHYRENVQPLLDGRARAMVVVGSRLEAVRWQLAMRKYIAEQGYDLKTLVAFSGEVHDPDSGPEPFKETQEVLNPGLNGRGIARAFDDGPYRLLIVANKFQTGFDQPLLCGMYVDRRLAGVQAVQTLSRLNRCHPGKEETYVLDFANEPEEILKEFKKYHATATLSDVTDRELILDLKAKLDGLNYYDEPEVDRVVRVMTDPKSKQSQLEAALNPVADRLCKRFNAARDDARAAAEAGDAAAEKEANDAMAALWQFKGDMATYVRAYGFLSQIVNFGNPAIEARSVFFRALERQLKFGREREGVDLSEVLMTHHALRNMGKRNLDLGEGESPALDPMTEAGSGAVRDKEKVALAALIEQLNSLFGEDATDGDQLAYARTLRDKALESDTLRKQAGSNSKEQFAESPDLDDELMKAVIDSMDVQAELGAKAVGSKAIRDGLRRLLLDRLDLYERLRTAA
ncbi:type I restriction endonuclease subunit R [Alienimonas californiensis]|uniref:Helicase ATP-binding domain-containing protein n=1 Tax=Alienimonas californiensis TaxID=2527989 RepID=A0A517P6R3_9PLAN|nr:type I restriction endonuclease [Alienimonas californiensis]QDT15068.1 hypothetical protein CA12_11480 [Alienimonas californiensis]